MSVLRDMAYERSNWSEDEALGVIPWDGAFVVLGWYKRRGRTQLALVVECEKTQPLTLADADHVIAGKPRDGEREAEP